MSIETTPSNERLDAACAALGVQRHGQSQIYTVAICHEEADNTSAFSVGLDERGLIGATCHTKCQSSAMTKEERKTWLRDKVLPYFETKGCDAKWLFYGIADETTRWPLPTDQDVTDASDRLLEDPSLAARLNFLRKERGLKKSTVKHFGLYYLHALSVGDMKVAQRRYMIPVRDHDGRIVNVRRYKPEAKRNKNLHWTGHGKGCRVFPFPEVTEALASDKPLLWCESELDAIKAWQEGRDLLIPATGTHGAGTPPADLSFAEGKVHYVAYDCDDEGRRGARKLARRLLAADAKAVHILDLGLGAKEDVTDWFVQHGRTVDDLMALAEHAPEYTPEDAAKDESDDPEPEEARFKIDVGKNAEPRDIAAEAVARLLEFNEPPTLFQRDRLLIDAHVNERTKKVLTEPLSQDDLQTRAVKVGGFYAWKGQGDSRHRRFAQLPFGITGHIFRDRDLWTGIPELDVVAQTPYFTTSGDLVSEPGYHEDSRTLFIPPPGFNMPPVSAAPTKSEVRAAVSLIHELIYDFPFVNEASRAHAFAMLIQPFIRKRIWGPTPAYFVRAPQRGNGKSLLPEVCMFPAHGEASRTSWPGREEERKKYLTSVMAGAQPVVFFDNVEGHIKSDAFAALLTSTTWGDRILGKSVLGDWSIWQTFIMTGNNPSASGDMLRRLVVISVDARMERPYERSADTFWHKGLKKWVGEERWNLVWAACTLVQSWLAAGCPEPSDNTPPIGSYESWRRVMGGILTHAGVEGFLRNFGQDVEADEEDDDVRLICRAAWANFREAPWTCGQVLALLREDWPGDEPESERNPFMALLPDRSGSLAKPMGKALTPGRIVDGRVLSRSEKPGRSGYEWWLDRKGSA